VLCHQAVELTGSSYHLDVCLAIGNALKGHPEVEVVLFDDMFTRRQKPQIHPALAHFATCFQAFQRLTWLDLRSGRIRSGARGPGPLCSHARSRHGQRQCREPAGGRSACPAAEHLLDLEAANSEQHRCGPVGRRGAWRVARSGSHLTTGLPLAQQ
jgi:hypothetical protein